VLRDAFLPYLDDAALPRLEGEGDLEEWLAESLSCGRKTWPELGESGDAFLEHLAGAVSALPDPTSFRTLHAVDLYLTSACTRGEPRALELFEERYFPLAERAVHRLKLPRTTAEELLAGIREKLFFPTTGARPLVGAFSGRGDLRGWIHTIVVHAAMKARAEGDRKVDLADVSEPVEPHDPELAYLKSLYGREFKLALSDSISALPPRERNILRQRFLDGLNIDALGALYGVHRATAARWINDACDAVLSDVRKRLAQRLGLKAHELDTIIRMAQSELDLSFSRLFRDP
jgi:RNA polymerase sigma-70 factor, ECF subfamily